MINVVEDVVKILKNDRSHNVKVVVEPNGVTIFLNDRDYDDSIPIKYDCVNGICIDNKKQKGVISIYNIDIIKNIMKYLKNSMDELDELCTQCDWSDR